jgi:DNA invertase Pin-like site-specific DNA recombinase
MLVGYGRTSTADQVAGLEAQERDLHAAGCEKLFIEHVSSVDMPSRIKLIQAIEFIREGDTFVITKLDRLARSVTDLLSIVEQIHDKGVHFRILNMGIDTGTPTGKLMLTILGGVAEFEREIMLERQREGIAKAKAAGKYKGRKPTALAKTGDILRLKGEGMKPADICRTLNIGKTSLYRILRNLNKEGAEL